MPSTKQTKSQQRLLRLFKKIPDEVIRDVIVEVITIEGRYRSAARFPLNQLRAVIDEIAKRQENL